MASLAKSIGRMRRRKSIAAVLRPAAVAIDGDAGVQRAVANGERLMRLAKGAEAAAAAEADAARALYELSSDLSELMKNVQLPPVPPPSPREASAVAAGRSPKFSLLQEQREARLEGVRLMNVAALLRSSASDRVAAAFATEAVIKGRCAAQLRGRAGVDGPIRALVVGGVACNDVLNEREALITGIDRLLRLRVANGGAPMNALDEAQERVAKRDLVETKRRAEETLKKQRSAIAKVDAEHCSALRAPILTLVVCQGLLSEASMAASDSGRLGRMKELLGAATDADASADAHHESAPLAHIDAMAVALQAKMDVSLLALAAAQAQAQTQRESSAGGATADAAPATTTTTPPQRRRLRKRRSSIIEIAGRLGNLSSSIGSKLAGRLNRAGSRSGSSSPRRGSGSGSTNAAAALAALDEGIDLGAIPSYMQPTTSDDILDIAVVLPVGVNPGDTILVDVAAHGAQLKVRVPQEACAGAAFTVTISRAFATTLADASAHTSGRASRQRRTSIAQSTVAARKASVVGASGPPPGSPRGPLPPSPRESASGSRGVSPGVPPGVPAGAPTDAPSPPSSPRRKRRTSIYGPPPGAAPVQASAVPMVPPVPGGPSPAGSLPPVPPVPAQKR